MLSGLSLLISRSGKNRKTEGLQGKKVKKTTSCNTDLCVTQGRLILVFSWVLSGYQFLPFWKKLRMRGFTLKYLRFIPTLKCKTNINCFWLGILTWNDLIWYRLSQFYEVFLLLLSNSYHLDAIKNSVNKYLLHSIRFQLSQYAINRFHNRLQKSSW